MAGRLYPTNGRSVLLAKSQMVVGRAEGSDIRLDDVAVSGRHCVLIFDGANWMVTDLYSRNGTRVNDVPVEQAVLKPGDTLVVAHKFRFAVEYDPAAERERFLGQSGTLAAAGPKTLREALREGANGAAGHGPTTGRVERDDRDQDVWKLG